MSWPMRVAALLAWAVSGCMSKPEGPPQRDCQAVIWARAELGGAPSVAGSWDDYSTPGATMQPRDDGWYALALDLPAGEHRYLIVEAGAARTDPHNPLTSFRVSDGREVSRLFVPDCGEPELRVDEVAVEAGGLAIAVSFWAAQAEPLAPLDVASLEHPPPLELDAADFSDGTIALRGGPLARGRHAFELAASDTAGRPAHARVSVFIDPLAASWADATVYQIMIDRFYADGGVALASPPTPAARAGGTLGGIEAALEQGYFESLGVSALWLSPVYQTPVEARLGTDGRLYEGYHGYWIERPRAVEPRIGGEQALRSLIAAAHARGIAVILDVVPNHVYETHEIVAAHRGDGWFNEHPSECVCGTPSCPWSAFMQDCWFAPYLPDLRLEHPDAMSYAVADLLWWLDEFEVDGLRIDAVPMMPRAASRRIAHEVRRHTAPGRDRLLLGEVFTGAGPAGVAGLRHYLGPDGLDSAFDFPLMWAIREVLAGSSGFVSLDALLDHTDAELAGSGAVLGRMLGNHDVVRLSSALAGDAGGDPWDEPAAQLRGDTQAELAVLERVALGLTLQLTLPGMPVLYYGDELGLAGAGDPDNRRVMPELASLSPARGELLDRARTLGQLRRCSAALRTGTRETLHVGEDTYAYARVAADGRRVTVLLSRADEPRTIGLPGSAVPDGAVVDVLSGAVLELGAASGTVELGPRSAVVLLAADDPCKP